MGEVFMTKSVKRTASRESVTLPPQSELNKPTDKLIVMVELVCVGGTQTSIVLSSSVLIELPNVKEVKLVCNSVCLVFVNKAHGLYLWIVYIIIQVSDLLH